MIFFRCIRISTAPMLYISARQSSSWTSRRLCVLNGLIALPMINSHRTPMHVTQFQQASALRPGAAAT